MFRRGALLYCAPFVADKVLASIMEKFGEARELLQDARESQGTSYFEADLEDAQKIVEEVTTEWKGLLDTLNEKGLASTRDAIEKANSLKIQQLTEEYDVLTHDDD
eukprot:GILI01027664.1.p1 GENE.GILI01027664.1~~GILI01027664.1.p1  ORF type:complete len:106 (+),score=19.43 GILI01027664.1:356-673(+)